MHFVKKHGTFFVNSWLLKEAKRGNLNIFLKKYRKFLFLKKSTFLRNLQVCKRNRLVPSNIDMDKKQKGIYKSSGQHAEKNVLQLKLVPCKICIPCSSFRNIPFCNVRKSQEVCVQQFPKNVVIIRNFTHGERNSVENVDKLDPNQQSKAVFALTKE